MKERGVYHSDLDINVVDSTTDSHNNPQSFEFFQVFLGQLNCVPHKRSYCLIQNLQKQIENQNNDDNEDDNNMRMRIGMARDAPGCSHCSERINLQKPLHSVHSVQLQCEVCCTASVHCALHQFAKASALKICTTSMHCNILQTFNCTEELHNLM